MRTETGERRIGQSKDRGSMFVICNKFIVIIRLPHTLNLLNGWSDKNWDKKVEEPAAEIHPLREI